MADGKKSFLIYCDWIHTYEKLSNEQAGALIKHTFRYVNDQDPKLEDHLLDVVFEQMKHQLKRDLLKYEQSTEAKVRAANLGNLKRWNLDLYKLVESNEIDLDEAMEIVKSRKVSQCDNSESQKSQKVANVAVIVTGKDIVTDTVNKDNSDFDSFWNIYDKKTGRKDCIAKWNRLSSKDRYEILKTLPEYIKSTPDKKFRKDPSTYLNGECWKDEIITKTETGKQSIKSQSSNLEAV